MGEAELILVVLAGYYLFECGLWLRDSAVVFISPWGGAPRPFTVDERGMFHRDDASLVMTVPLPISRAWVCEYWPVSIGPLGISELRSQSLAPHSPAALEDPWFVPFDGLAAPQRDGKTVLVGGHKVRCCTTSMARRMHELITRLTGAAPAEREAIIRQEIALSLSAQLLPEKLNHALRATSLLDSLCCTMWLYLFVFCPLVIALQLRVGFLQVAVGYLLLLAMHVVVHFFTHRVVRPGDWRGITRGLLVSLVSPADAMHAADVLLRELLADGHPLAVSRLLCSDEVFADMARRTLLALHHPLAEPAMASPAGDTQRWLRGELLAQATLFIETAGLKPAELLAAPAPDDDQCKSHCPRCRRQFVQAEGECPYCAGVRLVQFQPASRG